LTAAGVPPARIGAAIAGWLVAAGIANLAGPWISDRVGLRRPVIITGAVLSGLALSMLAVMPASASFGLLAVAALGGGAFAPILLTLPVELRGIGPARAGAAL